MSTTPPQDSKYGIVVNQLPPDPGMVFIYTHISQFLAEILNRNILDFDAPFGYEPEGSSCCGESFSEDDTLKQASYTKWSNNLPSLLNSKSGLKAFQRFLEKTNVNHFEMLRFLFACKGVSESKKPNDKEVLLKVIFQ